jgi:hypothetical protein
MTTLTNVDADADAPASDSLTRDERIPTGTPYLSVVATARNDNHGGDLLQRMQVFVTGLAEQCKRHKLEAELILVEWNPPEDRPRLADALEWPDTPWCSIRIVEVPHDVHARLEYSDRLPLFQMIAKNVGIRRARGEFVLATNVDILFPDALMEELARRDLQPDLLYRVDRYDVEIAPDPSLPIDETLRLSQEHVVRICARMGTTDLLSGTFYRIYPSRRLPLWARRLRYYWQGLIRRLRDLGPLLSRVLRRALRELVIAVNACVAWVRGFVAILQRGRAPSPPTVEHPSFHISSARRAPRQIGRTLVAQARLIGVAWKAEAARIPLHTNASGDFTLLSRQAWGVTRAYPELEMFSMHLDALFLYQAHYAGFAEKEFTQPIFHIEHSHGFKPAPHEVRTLNTRLERAAIGQIMNGQYMRWITEMYRTQSPLTFNSETWGLADDELLEITPVGSRQEVAAE